MPRTEATPAASSTELPRSGGVIESRIDAPHVLGDGPPPNAEPIVPDGVGGDDSTAVETLALVQAQAQQLSGHLRQRAEELDAREAQIQAQIAAVENELRAARLSLAERSKSLDEQATELDHRQRQLNDRAAELTQLEEAIREQATDQAERCRRQDDEYAARKQQLNVVGRRLVQQRLAHQKATDRLRAARRRFERDVRLERQQIDARRQASLALIQLLLDGLAQRRAALEQQEQQLADREATLFARVQQRAVDIDTRLNAVRLREERLAAGEELLTQQQAECHTLRDRLAARQQEWEAQRRAAEEDWTARRAEAELALKQRQLAVERRSEEVDSRRLSLEQLQAGLRQTHRESLEMRLAAEELAAQLAGTVPPAAVTSAIGRLRARLADHFRLATADLAHQHQELRQLREQLVDQHERLSAQKSDLQQWLERRQDEIDQQAARLACREQELDWQQQQMESIQTRWHDERQHYQDQVRKLLAELRRQDPIAA